MERGTKILVLLNLMCFNVVLLKDKQQTIKTHSFLQNSYSRLKEETPVVSVSWFEYEL